MRIIQILFVYFFIDRIGAFPCPSECICKSVDIPDVDSTRMSYLIDCQNVTFTKNQLQFQAQPWSINEARLVNNDDSDTPISDYAIALDLSNNLSFQNLTSESISLKGFSFDLRSLSLTSQSQDFSLHSQSFNSEIYSKLRILNLSSCCQQMPSQCESLLSPLQQLQMLDLSYSDLYKTCLKNLDSIPKTLRDVYLRGNTYEIDIFSSDAHLLDGIGDISGHLDLQNSRFATKQTCVFNIFSMITSLDISNIQFASALNVHPLSILNCQENSDGKISGEKLSSLYLRQLYLDELPSWLTNERFPNLNLLDLSNNKFSEIKFDSFTTLQHISLAMNPLNFRQVKWRGNFTYGSIDLCSTIENRTIELSHRLNTLFKLTNRLDYSNNRLPFPSKISNISSSIYGSGEVTLNLSNMNLNSFEFNSMKLSQLDISGNNLIELYLNQQKKLEYLDCSNQRLEKLVLHENLSKLKMLNCSGNSLSTIENYSPEKKSQLQLIDLSMNQIQSLNYFFEYFTGRYLQTVRFQRNQIETVPSKIFHSRMVSLFEVDLSYNRINIIEKNSFQSPNLQILDLTGNPLKSVHPHAFITRSLKLFYIFNDTKELTLRCSQSKSVDPLVLSYVDWFKNNGTFMKAREPERTKWIQSNSCFNKPSKSQTIITAGKRVFSVYSIYMTVGTILILLLFGAIWMYRKNQFVFRRYKRVDQRHLITNPREIDEHQCEDDEIVMNLEQPPYRALARDVTNV